MLYAHIISYCPFVWGGGVKVTVLFCVGGNLLWFTYNGPRNICNMV